MIFLYVISVAGAVVKPDGDTAEFVKGLLRIHNPEHVILCLSQIDMNSKVSTKSDMELLKNRFRNDLQLPSTENIVLLTIKEAILEIPDESRRKDHLSYHNKLLANGALNI